MQKFILDGLMVGVTSVVVGGGLSTLIPGNLPATLVGSGIGALTGSILVAKQKEQDVSNIQEQVRLAQTELHSQQSAVSHLRDEIDLFKTQQAQSKQELSLKQAETDQAQAEAALLERQMKEAQASIVTLEQQLALAQAEIATLETQLKQANDELLATQSEVYEAEDEEPDSPLPEDSPDRIPEEPQGSISQETLILTDPASPIPVQPANGDRIADWFAAKQISIERQYQAEPQDDIFNKHAIYLGERLKDENDQPLLSPLLKQIRWSINQGQGIRYFLKNASQAHTGQITQFCCNLYNDSLLSSYRYVRDNKTIHAMVQDRADVKQFFNGTWFERFIAFKVCKILDDLNLSYSFTLNPKIKLANDDKFELDLFFLIDETPLLIECKTGGNFTAHIKRFADHCKRLSLSASNAYLVILNLDDDQAESLSQLWSFRVVNSDQLALSLQQTLSPVTPTDS